MSNFVRSATLLVAVAASCSLAWGQTAPQNRPQLRVENVQASGGAGQGNRGAAGQAGGRAIQPVVRNAATAGRNPGPQNEPMIPCPFDPLSADEQKYLDELLSAWEQRSSKIERYRCDFERWEYDPVFGPKDPTQWKTYGTGKLRYASPDKGLFKVEQLSVHVPAAEGEKPQWLKRPAEEIGEHWVCDGKRIFTFDARKKQIIEQTLPPEMQGKAIVDGPLPFLFGAKKEKIKARYWLRVITPGDVEGEYWLEAAPRFRKDAQNFKMIHIILDDKDFLPKALQAFDPSFDPEKHPKRSVYTFNKRESNWNVTLQSLNFFHREFYEPSTPLGWKKVIEPFFPEPGEQQAASPKPPQAQAKRSTFPFKLPVKLK